MSSETDSSPGTDITDEDIRQLRVEAGQAGDYVQSRICDIALGDTDPDELALLISKMEPWMGDKAAIAAMTPDEAWGACVQVIEEAQARSGEDDEAAEATARAWLFGE